MQRALLAICAAIAISLSTAFVTSVSAQSAENGGNALRISPVRADLTINPGETKSVDVTVTNVTDKPATLRGIVNDFGPSDDESGQPRVYFDEKSAAPSRGLKKYIETPEKMTLGPKEQRRVKVTIKMPGDAGGGGYFGVVRFAPAEITGRENVTLSGSVGTLLLVTVPGDIVEKASLKTFNVARMNGETLGKASTLFTNGKKGADGKGLQAVLRVENSGNIQLAPFGKAILKKGGSQVATYELNETTPRSNVLPGSVRRFQIDLGDKTGSFGKYTLEGNFGYGSSGQLISAKTSFYVVPLPFLLAAGALVLLLILALVIIPRWLKSHDRRLLRKMRKAGRQ
jgi:hypothetical protein